MFDLELFKRSFHTIRTFGVKSILTILGIIVAVTAIVALIAIGQGFQDSVNEQFQNFGTNSLMILPGKTFMESPFSYLDERDAELIESVPRVDFAGAVRTSSLMTSYRLEEKTVPVIGISEENLKVMAKLGFFAVEDGTMLENQGGVILGAQVAEKKFEKELVVGNTIKIEGENFKVIGIMTRQRNFMTQQFSSSVIMLTDDFVKLSDAKPSRIFVKFDPNANVDDVKADIIRKLRNAHGEEDFQIMDSQQLIDSSMSIMGTIQIIVVGIAAIALIVGAIGVMNMMFMSVSNRKKEIGTMKAIGATDRQVIMIFLTEAMLMGMIGGVVGAGLGVEIALLSSVAATQLDFKLNVAVTPELILFAVLFAGIIGIISGVLPAIRASKMDPVEAMRG